MTAGEESTRAGAAAAKKRPGPARGRGPNDHRDRPDPDGTPGRGPPRSRVVVPTASSSSTSKDAVRSYRVHDVDRAAQVGPRRDNGRRRRGHRLARQLAAESTPARRAGRPRSGSGSRQSPRCRLSFSPWMFAPGIVGTHQQRGDAAERVGERADERDRAADAHQHRLDAEAGVQRRGGRRRTRARSGRSPTRARPRAR